MFHLIGIAIIISLLIIILLSGFTIIKYVDSPNVCVYLSTIVLIGTSNISKSAFGMASTMRQLCYNC